MQHNKMNKKSIFSTRNALFPLSIMAIASLGFSGCNVEEITSTLGLDDWRSTASSESALANISPDSGDFEGGTCPQSPGQISTVGSWQGEPGRLNYPTVDLYTTDSCGTNPYELSDNAYLTTPPAGFGASSGDRFAGGQATFEAGEWRLTEAVYAPFDQPMTEGSKYSCSFDHASLQIASPATNFRSDALDASACLYASTGPIDLDGTEVCSLVEAGTLTPIVCSPHAASASYPFFSWSSFDAVFVADQNYSHLVASANCARGGGNQDFMGYWAVDNIQCVESTDEPCSQDPVNGSLNCPPGPTCNDGIFNGDESNVDCGGSCGACGGGTCNMDADCNGTTCKEETCTGHVSTLCESDQDCTSTTYSRCDNSVGKCTRPTSCNPGICDVSCLADDDCGVGEICAGQESCTRNVSQQCSTDAECESAGSYNICDNGSGHCGLGCGGGTCVNVANADGEGCTFDSECASGFCAQNDCSNVYGNVSCSFDSDCSTFRPVCSEADGGKCGSSCTAGICAPNPNAHCTNGVQDEDETGVDCGGADCTGCDECQVDSECSAGQSCNTILNPNQCVGCFTNSDCFDGLVCTSDICIDNQCQNPTLPVGAHCIDGVCDGDGSCQGCLVDSDCGAGELCSGNECVECTIDSQCPDDGNECTASVCIANTCENKPVDNGQVCAAGVCGDGQCVGCNTPADCGVNPTCGEFTCNADQECELIFANPGLTGTACVTPNMCDASQNCVECISDANCPGSEVCDAGVCVECSANDQCGSVTECAAPFCTATNTCDAGLLPAGTTCTGGVCDGANNCVGCLDNFDCAGNPNGEMCDPSTRQCVACLNASDCSDDFECTTDQCIAGSCVNTTQTINTPCAAGAGVCNGNTCQECNEDSHCIGNANGEVCDTTSGTCVGCVDDGQCEDGDPCTTNTCNAGTCASVTETGGLCECLSASDCQAADVCSDVACVANSCQYSNVAAGSNDAGECPNVCDGSGECVECLSNSECAANGEVCDTINNVCVACNSVADCGAADTCHVMTCSANECVQVPEQEGETCTGGVCSDVQTCVECVDDTQCASGLFCGAMNTCVACESNAQCDDGISCTSDVCNEAGVCSNIVNTAGTQCIDGAGEAGVCLGDDCVECGSDSDCSNGELCNLSNNTCQECLSDVNCEDGNECTEDVCNGGTCSNLPTTGDTCSGSGVCNSAAQCVGCLTAADCGSGDSCEAVSCVNSVCETNNIPVGGSDIRCDTSTPLCDGSGICVECNVGSDCASGLCVENACVECVAASDCGENPNDCFRNECQLNTCIAVHEGAGAQCDFAQGEICANDSDSTCVECLEDAHCLNAEQPLCSPSNTCVACLTDSQCNDANACTTDLCSNNVCVNDATAIGSDCSGGVCNGAGTCEICNVDQDCVDLNPSNPVCLIDAVNGNSCVECNEDTICDDGNDCTINACNRASNTCDVAPVAAGTDTPSGVANGDGQCVQCLGNEDCATGFCDIANNVCTGCLADTDCPVANQCQTSSCIGSGASQACAPVSNLPNGSLCTDGGNACVEGQCEECFVDNDCGVGEVCNPSTFTCMGCFEDTHCGGSTPFCDVVNNVCASCLADSDCSDSNECTADQCVNGTCTFESLNAGDACSAGVCDGAESAPTCIECLGNTHCGGSEPFCVNDECVACQGDEDCPASLECFEKLCQDGGCSADVPMVQGESCVMSTGQIGFCDGAGTCNPCNVDADCQNGQFCSGQNICVGCLNDTHCPDDGNACTSESCVNGSCENANLPAGTQSAEGFADGNGQCVSCLSDANCNGASVCNPANNECTGCVDDSDCGGLSPICSSGTCVACDADSDCNDGNDCTDDTCVSNTCSFTNTPSGTSVPGGLVADGDGHCVVCASSSDCNAGAPICDLATNQCVGCLSNSDCNDDGNECTIAVCSEAGVCTQNDVVVASPCGDGNLCDGTGGCVECLGASDCDSDICDAVSNTCSQATCSDGVQNGAESGVDCGGPLCPQCPVNPSCNASNSDCNVGSDCTSGVCETNAGCCVAPTCSDGVQNQDETDIDCGGVCGATCQVDEGCDDANDCLTQSCDATSGLCVPSACNDGVMNGQETDIDCGGPTCDSCDDGKDCLENSDCDSLSCPASNTCVTETCTDGIMNGDETDTDCGGGTCPDCIIGEVCADNSDCVTNLCVENECVSPTCDDGNQNGLETDVDCGGPDCQGCEVDEQCDVASDCLSYQCGSDGLCDEPNCNDGFMNGNETDVDCGGEDCAPCNVDQGCVVARDCQTEICTNDTCAAPSCFDGMENGDETGVDCGGADCSACPSDSTCHSGAPNCSVDSDCVSGNCDAGCCVDSSCSDGIQNGGESDVDCGNECGSTCEPTEGCDSDDDCTTLLCHEPSGRCVAPSCSDGQKNQGEFEVDCGGPNCDACPGGSGPTGCTEAPVMTADCVSFLAQCDECLAPTCSDGIQNQDETDEDCGGVCGNTCEIGEMCDANADCTSNDCDAETGVCTQATCTDTLLNNSETGVDCGGGDCPRCDNYIPCEDGVRDCISGICRNLEGFGGRVCVPPTCTDGVRNQGETDVMATGGECGGPNCQPCPTGDSCLLDRDCVSEICDVANGFVCIDPVEPPPPAGNCFDGIQNNDEEGVDCGGSCGDIAECCENGILDGDESAIDRGGRCGSTCQLNDPCVGNADCRGDLFCYRSDTNMLLGTCTPLCPGAPNPFDCDSDGFCNNDEWMDGTNACMGGGEEGSNDDSWPDLDGDDLPNWNDPDDDGDTIPTSQEHEEGSEHGLDQDNDGDNCYYDLESDGDGIPDADEPNDENNDGVPDYLQSNGGCDQLIEFVDCPATLYCGGNYRCGVRVRNVGNGQCYSNVSISVTLPNGVIFDEFTGAGWTCSETGGVVSCDNAANLNPAGDVSGEIVFTVDPQSDVCPNESPTQGSFGGDITPVAPDSNPNNDNAGHTCEIPVTVDGDNDGVDDNADNCPEVENPGQEDANGYTDGDGAGDACEDVNSYRNGNEEDIQVIGGRLFGCSATSASDFGMIAGLLGLALLRRRRRS